TTSEAVEYHPARAHLLHEPPREVERVVYQLRADRSSVLAHVVEDRSLGARGDDRLGDAVDPDARSAPASALAFPDRLEGIDPVGPRVLPKAEEHHPRRAVRHEPIITQRPWPRGTPGVRPGS